MTDLEPRELVVVSSRPPGGIAALRELWTERDVVRAFGVRTFRVRYKQTALGFGWTILQPLAFLIPFSLFFGRVAKIDGGGVPYAAFAISALVPWQFVSDGVNLGANSVILEAALMRKVYFPREAPVLGTIGAAIVDLLIALALGIPAAWLLGGKPGIGIVFLPLLIVALVIPTLAIVLPLAATGVYYRDFRYALPLVTQVWLFASPVVFPLTRVPEQWRLLYTVLNPVSGILDGFRRSITLGVAPSWSVTGASLASSTVLLVVGYRIFKRFEPEFADIV